MKALRILATAVAAAIGFGGTPAYAQFFFKAPDFSGPRVTGAEPGVLVQQLPGATPVELRSALVWNLRAALNVAALQCQFAPTLQTLDNYNAILFDHLDELDKSYDTLDAYFTRIAGSKKAGLNALDQFGTRVYSSYSTVSAQLGFCQTASEIGTEALFVERGGLGDLAERRMRKLRNSLVPGGEQQFPYGFDVRTVNLYRFDTKECWRRGVWQERKCGPYRISA